MINNTAPTIIAMQGGLTLTWKSTSAFTDWSLTSAIPYDDHIDMREAAVVHDDDSVSLRLAYTAHLDFDTSEAIGLDGTMCN